MRHADGTIDWIGDFTDGRRPVEIETAAAVAQANDGLAAQMTCGICHDIFYRPVTVAPCAHNFCEACYAECAERSSRCAYCRVSVIGVQRNHGMAAMVETFLGQNPGMQRSAEQRMEMDARAAAAGALSPVPQRAPEPEPEPEQEPETMSKVDESVEVDDPDPDLVKPRATAGRAQAGGAAVV